MGMRACACVGICFNFKPFVRLDREHRAAEAEIEAEVGAGAE